MVLLPCSKCCGPCWRCFSDVDTVGYDAAIYQCVGPGDTPPDGFLPVGDCHKTQAECEAACGPWKCNEREVSLGGCSCSQGQQSWSELSLEFLDFTVRKVPTEAAAIGLEDQIKQWVENTVLFHDPANTVMVPGPGPFPQPIEKWSFTCGLIENPNPRPGAACEGQYLFENTWFTVNEHPNNVCNLIRCEGERLSSTIVQPPTLETGKGYQEGANFPENVSVQWIIGGQTTTTDLPQFTIGCLPEGKFSQEIQIVTTVTVTSKDIGSDGYEGRYFVIGTIRLNGNIRYSGFGDTTIYQCDGPEGNLDSGWTPVGDPHPDQASCEAACGTTKRSRTMPTTATGPGTQLANLLKWFGIHAKEKGCGCRSYQKKMDKGGPQWCRDHKEEILDHLAKEAKKRKLPFVKLAASKLIDLAIRRSERG